MYVCICNGVTDRDIRKAAFEGTRTLSELKLKTGCGTSCGRCEDAAREILCAEFSTPPVLRIVRTADSLPEQMVNSIPA
jgi:bacterioferritin-associated ferredoxin